MRKKDLREQGKRQTYLLRFWFEPDQGCWRAHVKEAATQSERVFANFPELVAYLAQRLGEDGGNAVLDSRFDHGWFV